jgi:hypothetical protein
MSGNSYRAGGYCNRDEAGVYRPGLDEKGEL